MEPNRMAFILVTFLEFIYVVLYFFDRYSYYKLGHRTPL